ncbi:MAG TPA: YebC/PmpR family DNA-binding transcriptional regulator [Thermoanaerobaculia bacterium]|nr:YebC/PmpR family DNA-binding transcriptional regulator [Thermoanaerobaculia bacterium]
MAGHSKWAGIKHKKAVIDAKRAKRWTKLIREVMVSARLGGGDPDFNPRLRSAVLDAKADNVPNETIDRAIKKGTGDLEGESYEEVSYEGYGPAGVAVLVEAMTDNRNRTAAEIRHLFSKHGGNLGESGCVAWMFDRRGYFAIERGSLSEEGLMELALELGVEDIELGDEAYELYTAPEDYARVRDELETRGIDVAAAELAMIPQSTIEPGEKADSVLRLVDAIEDHDDVQHVWANFEVDEGVLAAQTSE